jgi:hypothetical protein
MEWWQYLLGVVSVLLGGILIPEQDERVLGIVMLVLGVLILLGYK